MSPRIARVTGGLYLLTILAGLFAQGFVSERLVTRDAATTAANLLAHKGLYQAGFAIYLIEMASQVAVTALFFHLLEPVSRPTALVAAFIGLTGCTIKTIARLFFIAPLLVLSNPHDFPALGEGQLQSLSYALLRVNDRGAEIALVFFGVYALLTGYLVYRSTYLPRLLGAISMLGGFGWLTFLYPPLGHRLFPVIVLVALLGSLAMISWLLVKGLDAERWLSRKPAE